MCVCVCVCHTISALQHEAQVQLLREELSRKEMAAQRRVERVQRECQGLGNELKSHISEKQRVEGEMEQLRSAVWRLYSL